MVRRTWRWITAFLIVLSVIGSFQAGRLPATEFGNTEVPLAPSVARAEMPALGRTESNLTERETVCRTEVPVSGLPASTPAPSAVPTAAAGPLKRGDAGDAVAKFQQRLNEIGFSVGAADGQFDAGTQAALQAFQACAGLAETGIADADTLALLYSEQARQYASAPDSTYIATPTPQPENEVMVWIPRTGECYHRRANCGNMRDPTEVALSTAQSLGYRPCGNCCR